MRINKVQTLFNRVLAGELKIHFAPCVSNVWHECTTEIKKKTGWTSLLGSVRSNVDVIGPIIADVVMKPENQQVMREAEGFHEALADVQLRAEVFSFFRGIER